MAPRGGESLLNGLQVAWSFDEHFDAPTNRFSDFGGQVLTNIGGLTGEARALNGGGVEITNAGTGYFTLTNTAMFGLNSSFTMAFWVCGGASGANGILGQAATTSDASYDWSWDGQNFLSHDVGGTLHQATGTVFSSSSWLFVVCGYDQANNQIFISNNGGARVNTSAGGSMRHQANMPFRIGHNPCLFDCLYFWNRVLTTAEITRLYNNGFPIQYPFSTKDAGKVWEYTYNWAIVQAGGTNISSANSNAVVNFVDGMVTTNLWSKVPMILALGGTTLKDALTPIKGMWQINGGNTFIFFNPVANMNNNFVDADVSINGMKGDGSTKYLNPGVNGHPGLSDESPSYNSAAQTIYMYTAGVEAGKFCFGGYDDFATPNNGIFGTAGYSGVGEGGAFGTGASQVFTNTAVPGYMTTTRVNSTELDVYIASSTLAHGLYAQGTTANTKASPDFNLAVTLFAISERNAGIQGLTTNTISYYSYAPSSFSAADSSNYFWLVENFLTTKGGGAAKPFTTDITNSVVLIGNSKTLYAPAAGSPSYQWQKNGVNIANATQSSYTVGTAALSDFGTYQCFATLSGRTYGSSSIQLATVTTTTVSNWVVQCAVNGASVLSSNTIWAQDQFWNGLVTDGLSSKEVVVNTYVPDSLTAALTPLLPGSGSVLWVNHNFVSGDLSVNGLTGNGSNKYLDTGFNASTGVSVDNAGISLYGYATTSGAYRDCGSYVVATDASFGLQMNASDIASGAANSGLGQSPSGVSVHPSPGNGFYSGNRVSSTDHRLFFANSGSAWAQIGNNSTTRTVTYLNGTVDVFASNIPTISADYEPSASTISYTSFRQGLSTSDGQNEYNRVQTLRQALGGGYR